MMPRHELCRRQTEALAFHFSAERLVASRWAIGTTDLSSELESDGLCSYGVQALKYK